VPEIYYAAAVAICFDDAFIYGELARAKNARRCCGEWSIRRRKARSAAGRRWRKIPY
jgi:hypothetical protein